MEANVPAGVDYEPVSRYFAEHVPEAEGPLTFRLIGDGRSNLTYLVEGPHGKWVMRRPPLGHVLPTAHDMSREHRVLAALADTDVPVPRPLALCEDNEVNGAPFYIMEYRPGVILTETLPDDYATTAEERKAMSLALVETLVKLHAIDYRAVGLEDFGRPEGYLERQVRRWSQQWERSKTRELPVIEELIRRLNAAIPESPEPTIVHGDYRLGNIALDENDPGHVIAIFDWEMSTLGDPLSDLGYTLGYWTNPEDTSPQHDRGLGAFTAAPGFLRREDLIEEYAKRTGRDVSNIAFYRVLAQYKLAVIVEGIHARYLQGKTVGEGFSNLGESTVRTAERALAIADQSTNPKLRGEF
jgi:aminoglycoside phosphotransferase (APT) family kinase protein